jgi:predicted RNA-binding protein with TRAM domain
MHGEVQSDTGAAHKAAGSGAEVEATESQEDGSNEINGLVLFVPGPPHPGLKS